MLDPLVNGITWIIHQFYAFTSSYGLAIIILTILIKIALYPLTVKQMRSLKITQQLQPKIKAVQEKYKNDPQKAQQAMMEVYKQYGANPLAGCLPLLIQLPILWAMFTALRKLKLPEGISASFLWNPNWHLFGNPNWHGWIQSLKDPDPLYILPLLAILSTYALQRMTTNMQDQTQRTMLYAMPLMIGFFTYSLPSGLGLYWVVSNLVGIVQQYFINKQPLPIEIKEEVAVNEGSHKKRKNNKGSR